METGRFASAVVTCFKDKRCQRRLIGHQARTFDFQFHGSEDCAVSASEDGTGRVWDLDSSKCIATLKGHTAEVLRASWAPPDIEWGTTLATGSADGTVRLWGVSQGSSGMTGVGKYRKLKCVGQLSHKGSGLDGQVYSCQFIPSSIQGVNGIPQVSLLTASDSSVHLWDVTTQKRLVQYQLKKIGENSIGGGRNPSDLPFVFDTKIGKGGMLAIALSDGTVRVDDLRCGGISSTTEHQVVLQAASETHLTGLCWSADGNSMVSCAGDGTINIWDVRTWMTRAVLHGHTRPVYGAAFFPTCDHRLQQDGGQESGLSARQPVDRPSLLLSWSTDGTILAWDWASAIGLVECPLGVMQTEGLCIYHCSISTDGTKLAIAGGTDTPSAFIGMPVRLCDLSGVFWRKNGSVQAISGK
ncbi:unnamed protein product [Choristocarpus tenellus]